MALASNTCGASTTRPQMNWPSLHRCESQSYPESSQMTNTSRRSTSVRKHPLGPVSSEHPGQRVAPTPRGWWPPSRPTLTRSRIQKTLLSWN